MISESLLIAVTSAPLLAILMLAAVYFMNTFKSVLNFGMYKGYTVANVFTHDAGYLKWAVSIGKLSFNEDDMERIEKKAKSESDAHYAEKYDGLSWGDFHT